MRPILTPFLALYWTTAFAVLALASANGGNEGTAHVMRMVGLSGIDVPASALAATLLAFGLALCAALFFWAFVQALLDGRIDAGDCEAVLRLAFGGAVATTCVLLVAGAFGGAREGLSSPTLLLAALAASYLAIAAERWISASLAEPADGAAESGARTMAVDAARHALLSRLGGRSSTGEWERPT